MVHPSTRSHCAWVTPMRPTFTSLTSPELGSAVSHQAGTGCCGNAEVFKDFLNVNSQSLPLSPSWSVSSRSRTPCDVGTTLWVALLYQNPRSWDLRETFLDQKNIHYRNMLIIKIVSLNLTSSISLLSITSVTLSEYANY